MTTDNGNVKAAVSCPSEDGGKTVKNGRQGGWQRYLCKECGSQFRELDVIGRGSRFPIEQVGAALQEYYEGLTYRETVRNVGNAFGIKPPDEANVHRWVQKYSRTAEKAVRHYKANTGREWLEDEYFVKIGGRPFWIWNVVDPHTRYLLVSYLTSAWDEQVAAEIMKQAEAASVNLPDVVHIELLHSSAMALFAVDDTRDVSYLANHEIGREIDNILSERLPPPKREPLRVLKRMKTLANAQNFLDGWRIDYNLFRPHRGLDGRTPAQAAGMDVPFSSWQDVVRMADPLLTDPADRGRLP